jgi:rhodanese-related sulfurtransferase
MNISPQKARKLIDRGAKLIDVRNPVDFTKGTLDGAVNIVLRNVSALPLKFKKTDTLVLFGTTDDDIDVMQFAKYAEQLGFTNVHSLGAMSNWIK